VGGGVKRDSKRNPQVGKQHLLGLEVESDRAWERGQNWQGTGSPQKGWGARKRRQNEGGYSFHPSAKQGRLR